MLGGHPLRVRRSRPDIWSDDEGRRESAGQYTASNELPCFAVISQFKSSILNGSQSTDPAKRTAARSGRIEARIGLRMMPTFPRSPLSFRTASFPQYGWKAGFPNGAFLGDRRFKPAPGIRRPPSSLHPPFVHLVVATVDRSASGLRTRSCTAMRWNAPPTPGALAQVRVVLSRSVITYSAPSAPLVGTSRFHRMAAYTRCLRCAGAPRRPTSGSGLSLHIPSWHAALSDPGESDIDIFQNFNADMAFAV
jgi:hypothetical protein